MKIPESALFQLAREANPNLIQLRIAERWNGALPMYTGNSIPMLQLPTNKP